MKLILEKYEGSDQCSKCAFNCNNDSCIPIMEALSKKGFNRCYSDELNENFIYVIEAER